MRIVVTGAAGFVGSHIVDALIARGDSVLAVDNLSTGKRENVHERAEFLLADARNLGAQLAGANAVIHAAAYADLRGNWRSEQERARLYRENVEVTRALLEQLPTGTAFLFLSTASVYGKQLEPRPRVETDALPWTCESPYAASKLACEAMVAAYALGRGFPWRIGRLVNVVGARTTHGVIGDFARMMNEKGRIHAADDGQQRKSWVHVSDVADAFLALLGRYVASGVYNITSEERISWWSVVDEMGVRADRVTFERTAGGAIGDPIDLHVSGAKLAMHYKPHRSVLAGVREALDGLGWKRKAVAA